MLKFYLFVFTLILVWNVSEAQTTYTPETPLAALYEKYIDYPVDHSTGAASIEIPLYTLKAGSIQVPINISYHTAGVKPSDPSLPVGLGWVIIKDNDNNIVRTMDYKYKK